jgi:hypothetical protein
MWLGKTTGVSHWSPTIPPETTPPIKYCLQPHAPISVCGGTEKGPQEVREKKKANQVVKLGSEKYSSFGLKNAHPSGSVGFQ